MTCDHNYVELYRTGNIRVLRCARCGHDVAEEAPFKDES